MTTSIPLQNQQGLMLPLLQAGLKELRLEIPLNQQHKLINFIGYLLKWNRTYNLTAIRNPDDMVKRHLLDSLTIAPYLQGESIIDVGTGAGLPGLPLAVLFPDKSFTLLDSNTKKTRFLLQVVADLKIGNISVISHRVEAYRPGYCFDSVISRAFSSLQQMLDLTRHLCCPHGQFLAMKGSYPAAELAEVEKNCMLVGVKRLNIPSLAVERHLVIFTPGQHNE